MVKHIDIEYCGGWGYGGPANRVKNAIQAAFPDLKIVTHSANGMTSKIDVAWIEDSGNKTLVWTGGKAAAEGGHAQIIALIKAQKWAIKQPWKRCSI